MWNGLYFKRSNSDRIYGISRIFFAPGARRPWAVGFSILLILLILSDTFLLFGQDLPTKLKADFQQDKQDSGCVLTSAAAYS